MASVIGGMLQTVFAGLAFADSGYLFKMLDKNGYEDKIKRHNKALEELAASKEKFYENEVKQRDRIQQLRQELSDGNEHLERTKHSTRSDRSKQYNIMGKPLTENCN